MRIQRDNQKQDRHDSLTKAPIPKLIRTLAARPIVRRELRSMPPDRARDQQAS
ncbi:MAG: hypothetical protein IJV43_05125 [Oscillospiraceae bacterium]|nr:hypothetical protein [Oscillospiraceae bacterium]